MEKHDPIARRVAAEITRRRFLQGSAMVGFSAFLAACSGGSSSPSASTAAAGIDHSCTRDARRTSPPM
jgi:nitrous oxide reductase